MTKIVMSTNLHPNLFECMFDEIDERDIIILKIGLYIVLCIISLFLSENCQFFNRYH